MRQSKLILFLVMLKLEHINNRNDMVLIFFFFWVFFSRLKVNFSVKSPLIMYIKSSNVCTSSLAFRVLFKFWQILFFIFRSFKVWFFLLVRVKFPSLFFFFFFSLLFIIIFYWVFYVDILSQIYQHIEDIIINTSICILINTDYHHK